MTILVTAFTKTDKFDYWSPHYKTTDNKQILSKQMMWLKCDNKINKVVFFQLYVEPSVKRKDFQAITLVGPLKDNWEPDPLAWLHLDNWLYIFQR